MIDTPRIVETVAQRVAIIPVTVPRERIHEVMGPGLEELRAVVAAQGIAAPGPWFTHHLRMDPQVFDFEIGVPVTAQAKPAGRVRASEWPAMRVVRSVYSGPYEGLGAAWGEFIRWIETQRLSPARDFWECYLSGPEASADPSSFRTQLDRPLLW